MVQLKFDEVLTQEPVFTRYAATCIIPDVPLETMIQSTAEAAHVHHTLYCRGRLERKDRPEGDSISYESAIVREQWPKSTYEQDCLRISTQPAV